MFLFAIEKWPVAFLKACPLGFSWFCCNRVIYVEIHTQLTRIFACVFKLTKNSWKPLCLEVFGNACCPSAGRCPSRADQGCQPRWRPRSFCNRMEVLLSIKHFASCWVGAVLCIGHLGVDHCTQLMLHFCHCHCGPHCGSSPPLPPRCTFLGQGTSFPREAVRMDAGCLDTGKKANLGDLSY